MGDGTGRDRDHTLDQLLSTSNSLLRTLTVAFTIFLLVLAVAVGFVIWFAQSGEDMSSVGNGLSSFALTGIVVTAIGINIALAALIPLFVSTYQITNFVDKEFEARAASFQKDVEKVESDLRTKASKRETEQRLEAVEVAEIKSDAHLSRAVAHLISENNPAIWAIGWRSRSLKRYARLIDKDTKYGKQYSELIRDNLQGIAQEIAAITPFYWYKRSHGTWEASEPRSDPNKTLVDEVQDHFSMKKLSRVVLNKFTTPVKSAPGEEATFQRSLRACKDLIDTYIAYDSIESAELAPSELYSEEKDDYLEAILLFSGLLRHALVLHVTKQTPQGDSEQRPWSYVSGKIIELSSYEGPQVENILDNLTPAFNAQDSEIERATLDLFDVLDDLPGIQR